LNYVTFTGTSPVQTAIMGGHIDAAFTNSTMMVSTRDQIKVLAMGAPERMNQLADVPTFKELGYEMYPKIARGVMAPKALPQAIQKYLEKVLMETTSKPEFRAKMEQAGFVPQGLGIADSHKYLDAEGKELQKLIQDFGLTM
jgi:tripartite-type tricarboxylate transporter receptor subunit TctC